QIYRTLSPVVDVGTTQGAPSHRALPHGSARRSSRPVCSLRPSGHLVQLLQKSPLSQVSDQRKGEMVARPAAGTAAGELLPPGFQRAACISAVDLAEPEDPIRAPV